MRRALFILAIFAIISCQNSSKKNALQYEINGKIENASDSTLVVISNETFKDSTIIINEKFSFSGNIGKPQKVILKVKGASDDKPFWLENVQISINGNYDDLKNAEFIGGENQRFENILWNQKKPIFKLMYKYINLMEIDSLEKFKRDSIYKEYQLMTQELKRVERKFVKDYPNTLTSSILLSINRNNWDKDSVIIMFDAMNKNIQNTEYGILVSEFLKIDSSPKIGDKYIDVPIRSTDDTTINISQLTGKLTLIDFWASWCIPCRKENPNLVELFKKYNNHGFNIIGVSMDRDKKKWLQAVKDDSLPWNNLIDLVGPLSNNIFFIYDVKFIPDNLLLNEEGIIIGRNISVVKLKEDLEKIFNF